METEDKKARNKFVLWFLAVGIFICPALMLFVSGVERVLTVVHVSPDLLWENWLYRIMGLLVSSGAILMMDAEHTPEILLALPFVTIANTIWYGFVGIIVWHIRIMAKLKDTI
ncbi:MAG TPA: hypothetical protein VK795_05160 [Terriglobales bacterium]|jgi:hypothetical protein|nr:hypothetical protein [Terriglobales bacterium]